MADCSRCGFQVEDQNYAYCPSCGSKIIAEEQNLIRYYFSRGYKYRSIVSLLSKNHGIQICERTLKSRLHEYGLQRRFSAYDEQQVRQRIIKELNGPGCMGGYRSIWHTLRMEGFQVPRHAVEEIVRELDAEGCELRKTKRLRRRRYHVPGQNYCWHLDGYDKLKPYGFPIHGCIDGWSRKIIWLIVARSNNKPEIPATFFLECIEEFGGCPVKVRTDCGTENGIISAMQCELRGSADAHVYGTSPANQRIEGWWSFFRRNRTTWWMNYFGDLIEKEQFYPGNELEMEALWYCFSGVLQKDLDIVKEHWNTHRIRDSRHNTIPGKPDELFYLPEGNGGVDGLLESVTSESIQYVSDQLLHFDNEINDYEEYFDYVLSNSDLQLPNDWKEAGQLYLQLIAIAI
jgi:DNA-directed RNA polymerase subunit RPC12/RpoP